jgi:predicted DNA-binding transcriptional regulator AlpA
VREQLELPNVELLDTAAVAAWLQVSPKCLERWRGKNQGPPWVKLGKSRQAPVRYRRSAVEAWIQSRKFQSTKEAAEADGESY